jgi:hypothetical protein
VTSVGTSSVLIASEESLIQNLGDDVLYVSDVDPATVGNGVEVQPNDCVAVGGGANFYAISEGTSDVRTLGRGSGYFQGTVPA